ncbi:helix-turn-helix transcriptional regulator [Martelella sp. AD-3]|uniref:helix-turn-helix domain-containing protein n=1 Tax=Martelella sp. AD-3 TaxID=686597 RepID=UPI000466A0B5|nr:helix-turn-helix transcriptional regulator [Martelella sp. AD-3]AMM84127.1 hypothetical protein AZF01_06955 [Martelella sp. AD-3]
MNKSYFESRIAAKGFTMRGLARQMGIASSQLSRTFSGHRRMKIEEAVELSVLLGVTVDEIIAESGINAPPPRQRTCPVIGYLTPKMTVLPAKQGERVQTLDGLPDGIEAIIAQVAGSSVSYMDGWAFFVTGKAPPEGALDALALVQADDGSQMLGVVRYGKQRGVFRVTLLDGREREGLVLSWARRVQVTRHC